MNKIMEYMALGRPIVSFDLVEARVSAGDAAVYAPANDEPAFARAIGALLDDPAKRAEMSRIGRMRVAGDLSWKTSTRNLLRAYHTLLTGAGWTGLPTGEVGEGTIRAPLGAPAGTDGTVGPGGSGTDGAGTGASVAAGPVRAGGTGPAGAPAAVPAANDGQIGSRAG
jgi:hypothetical protein